MRAVQFDQHGGPEVLQVREVATPEPGPGQIRIAVRRAGINPFDWKVREGRLKAVRTFPSGTGLDASGVVDALGEGVTGVAPGDEVFGLAVNRAATAEYCLLHHWAHKPASMSWSQAAALPLATETAMRALRDADLETGQTILIDGAAGAVGLAAVQFAREQGLTVVGSVGPDDDELMRRLGATPVRYGAGLAQRAAAASPGGYDWVFDLSGRMIEELITIAGDPDRVVGIVDHVKGPQLGIRDTASSATEGAFDALTLAADLFARGRFEIRIGAEFPMERTGEAQEANRSGSIKGKIIITVAD